VLQTGRGHRVAQRGLRRAEFGGGEGEDQTAGERVAAADPVDDGFGEQSVVLGDIVEHRAPVVVGRRQTLAQGDGDAADVRELLRHLTRHVRIAGGVEFAGMDVGVAGLDVEHVVAILLVGDDHVDEGQDAAHDVLRQFLLRRWRVPVPQFAAVVEVDGHARAGRLRAFRRHAGGLRRVPRQGGSDAAQVQPLRVGKNRVPVVGVGGGGGDGAIRPVIHHLARTLVGAGLEKIQTEPAAVTVDDVAGVDADPAHRVHRRLRQRVVGQGGDKTRAPAEVANGRGHAGLRARVHHLERARLAQSQIARRSQPAHDFPEGDDNIFHGPSFSRWCGSESTVSVKTSLVAPVLSPTFIISSFKLALRR